MFGIKARGIKWYLEKRGSRKILAQSRNLGSVFDGSRSLELFLPTDLRVSDLSILFSFRLVFGSRNFSESMGTACRTELVD